MAVELTHIVRDCPICGRPVEIQAMYVGHEVLCGHCRGSFVVFRSIGGPLAVTACRSSSLLERAERLLDSSDDQPPGCGDPRVVQLRLIDGK